VSFLVQSEFKKVEFIGNSSIQKRQYFSIGRQFASSDTESATPFSQKIESGGFRQLCISIYTAQKFGSSSKTVQKTKPKTTNKTQGSSQLVHLCFLVKLPNRSFIKVEDENRGRFVKLSEFGRE